MPEDIKQESSQEVVSTPAQESRPVVKPKRAYKREPTLKQKLCLKNLPEVDYNVAEAMRRAGYRPASIRAGKQYQALKHLTQNIVSLTEIDEQYIINRLLEESKTAKSASDRLRALELIGKWRSLFTDRTEITDKRETEAEKDILTRLRPYSLSEQNSPEQCQKHTV